jgi:hypothetical protein
MNLFQSYLSQSSSVTFRIRLATTLLITFTMVSGCEVADPQKEEVPELITTVTLTFIPTSGEDPVRVSATDPDGEGVQDIMVEGPVRLVASKSYTLQVSLINGLADPTQPEYDVTEEVEEEAEEHIIFFSWTNNLFVSPMGDGNVDNRSDQVNYEDEDANGLPLGLETLWTTAGINTGELRIVLKHQPDLKSETSDSSTGETDVDITFPIIIE